MARYLARLFLGYLTAAVLGAVLAIGYGGAARPAPEIHAYGPPAAYCFPKALGIGMLCQDAPHRQDI